MTKNYIPPKTVAELLERYDKGERDFIESDFDYKICDFRNLNLEGINFSKSFIVADFRGANLQKANFSNSNIKTCDFRGADLRNATFENAALCETHFEEAIFENTNFKGAFFHSHEMKECDTPDW